MGTLNPLCVLPYDEVLYPKDQRAYIARPMKSILFIALVVVLTGAAVVSGRVQLSGFEVRPEGADFIVTWSTDLEEDVREFEIQRRTPSSNDQFVKVHGIPGHGPQKAYAFRDTQVFKSGSDKLDYRLEVVYTNGIREVLRSQSLNYTSTATRRTWGSLKAMFQ